MNRAESAVRHVNIRITGMVHGVCFRACAKEEADELGIVGSVINGADGSVCIEAEAPAIPLQEFVAWCRRGPPSAIVREVSVEDGRMKHFTSFDIVFGR